MKKTIIFGILLFVIILISGAGCEITPTDKPYIKEIKLSPTDYLDSTTPSTKIVYTVQNPLKISFNGKVFFEFNEKCISMNKEQEITVGSGLPNSNTIEIRKINNYPPNNECYGEQQIIVRLSETNKLIYDSKQLNLRLIK